MTVKPDLYYLVRPNSNVRVLQFNNEPVIVTEDGLEDYRSFYESKMTCRLEAVPVAEYHQTYDAPMTHAETAAKFAGTQAATQDYLTTRLHQVPPEGSP